MPATAPKVKRPPRYTAYEEVEVDIDPEDLEDAGWVYVGEGADKMPDASSSAERTLRVVQEWHDDEHAGPFRWCQLKPCDDLRTRD